MRKTLVLIATAILSSVILTGTAEAQTSTPPSGMAGMENPGSTSDSISSSDPSAQGASPSSADDGTYGAKTKHAGYGPAFWSTLVLMIFGVASWVLIHLSRPPRSERPAD